MFAGTDLAAATLRSGKAHDRAQLLLRVVERVDLHGERVDVTVEVAGLQQLLEVGKRSDIDAPVIAIDAVRVRRGHQLRLIVPGPERVQRRPARWNDKLVALVAEAQQAKELVLAKPEQSIARIAKDGGRCRTRLTKLVALSCLAPDIITAIVEGKQPEHLTAKLLMDIALPVSWSGQRAALGFS